jgi:hypothetical protein
MAGRLNLKMIRLKNPAVPKLATKLPGFNL